MESPSYIEFEQVWSTLKRRWLPASLAFIAGCGTVVSLPFLQAPVYQAQGRLLIQRISSTSSVTDIGKEISTVDPLTRDSVPLDTEAETIRSLPVVQKTIEDLNLKIPDSDFPLKPEQFLGRLNVEQVSESDMLAVSYEDTDAQNAAAVVNALMGNYLKYNIRINQTEASDAREFIERQLPTAEANVQQAELALQRFKEKHKLIAPEEEANAAVSRLIALKSQITDTQVQIADVKTRSAAILNQLGLNEQQSSVLASLSQSSGVKGVLQELQQIESELATARTRFSAEHPTIIDLEEKTTQLKSLLSERVSQVLGPRLQGQTVNLEVGPLQEQLTAQLVTLQTDRLALEKKVATLSQLQSNLQERSKNLPSLERELRQLNRKLDASQSTYSTLLQKLQEIQVAENQNAVNARIVSPALIPEVPIGFPKSLYLAVGVMLGGALAAITTVALEAKDKSIQTIEQAQHIFEFNLLGMIPLYSALQNRKQQKDLEESIPEVFVKTQPRSLISESYRMLQSNLKSLKSGTEVRVIVVTSSVPDEGKSSVSANLAEAIAQTGSTVLLIDADLHRPIQHRIWGLGNEIGLGTILLLEQNEPRTVIQSVDQNLDVLPAGAVFPASPAALLDSQQMSALIQDCLIPYDFIIIDTSAVSVAADASALSHVADGVVLVVRPGVVDSASAIFSKNSLTQSGHHVLGLVVNGVSPDNKPYHRYYPELEKPQELAPPYVNGHSNGQIETITHGFVGESNAEKLARSKDSGDLEHMTLGDLKNLVENLQSSMDRLVCFVRDQEEELASHSQTIQLLKEQLKETEQSNRLTLEQEIWKERERTKMLNESLEGQRSHLREQEVRIREYLSILERKQSEAHREVIEDTQA